MATKNITLSMPAELVRRAKVLAAQHEMSVSSLVARLLEQLVGDVRDYDEVFELERRMMNGAGRLAGRTNHLVSGPASRTVMGEFVDTNVLLYAYDASAGERHEIARSLVERLWRDRTGALSVQVPQELYVNATHKVAATIEPAVAIDRLTSLTRWRVHAPLPDDVIAAASLSSRYQLSFWDAMIVRSAAELRCGTLWTEDLNQGRVIEGVRLADPFGRA